MEDDGVNLDVLCAYLDAREDSNGTVGYIRERWPKSLAVYVSAVRSKWLTLERHHPEYAADAEKAHSKAMAVLAEDKKAEAAVDKFNAFFDMNLAQKYKAQRKARATKFTGDARIDQIVGEIRLVPDFMNDFKLNDAERMAIKAKAKRALEKKSCTTWTVDAGALIQQARETLESDISLAFDLAAAIALLTGRRMIEIFKCGNFDKAPKSYGPRAAVFSGQAKNDGETPPYTIPLLCTHSALIKGLSRLRRMKPASDLTNAEVNARWSGRCNAAARKLLGAGRKFHDLREAYAVITHNLALPHAWSLNFWVSRMLGHAGLDNSLHYTCVNVVDLRDEDKIHWKDAQTGAVVPVRPT